MHKNTSNALKYTYMHSFVLFNYAKSDSKWTKYAKLEWRQSRTTAINTNNCEYNVIEILAIRFRRFQTDQKCISNRFEPDSRYFRFLINRFFRVNHVRKDHKPWGRDPAVGSSPVPDDLVKITKFYFGVTVILVTWWR